MAVAHDRKDPSAGIAAAIALKATICLKKRLLNDVLRYVGVTAEKACQVLRGAELKHDVPLEAILCVVAHLGTPSNYQHRYFRLDFHRAMCRIMLRRTISSLTPAVSMTILIRGQTGPALEAIARDYGRTDRKVIFGAPREPWHPGGPSPRTPPSWAGGSQVATPSACGPYANAHHVGGAARRIAEVRQTLRCTGVAMHEIAAVKVASFFTGDASTSQTPDRDSLRGQNYFTP